MDKRQLIWALLALFVVVAAAFGLSLTQFGSETKSNAEQAAEEEEE